MMPELPEVETIRREITPLVTGRPISGFYGSGPTLCLPDPIFRSEVKGRHITQTFRHGKYLFAYLDSGSSLVFHFGMTGDLRWLRTGMIDPPYCRAEISFHDGSRLVFTDLRRFGRITLTPDTTSFIRQKRLGPDALSIPGSEIAKLIRNSNRGIKVLLLDQHRVAGIGNIYADEILFQARIHPLRKTSVITLREGGRLQATLRSVLKTAVSLEADFDRYPEDWLIPHRACGEICPQCGEPVKRVMVSGRYAYFCPSCQR
jgi:formamidopyrimidine-DNA glycosylase